MVLSAMLLSSVVLSTMLLLSTVVRTRISRLSAMATPAGHILRTMRLATLEVDVDSSCVFLSPVLQPHLPAQLLDLGLQLLDMASRVVPLADNGMKVVLTSSLILANATFENALRLLDELAVQIDSIGINAAGSVVFAENEFGSLKVVFVHLAVVGLALVGELLCCGTVTIFVGASRAVKAGAALVGLGAGEVTETVVFALGLIVVARVKGWYILVFELGGWVPMSGAYRDRPACSWGLT